MTALHTIHHKLKTTEVLFKDIFSYVHPSNMKDNFSFFI